MITPEYCRTMARYNAWQNNNIWRIVEAMPLDEVTLDRGAFFGSIFSTLNHLLWGDQLWIARFDGGDGPVSNLSESTQMTATPAAWWAERFRTDGRIRVWADQLASLDTVGDLAWTSAAVGQEMSKPKAMCIVHFFNHQTHHRGQIHAMITASGRKTEDTDLVFMPEGRR